LTKSLIAKYKIIYKYIYDHSVFLMQFLFPW